MMIIHEPATFSHIQRFFKFTEKSPFVTLIHNGKDPYLGFALPMLVVDNKYLVGLNLKDADDGTADRTLKFDYLEFKKEDAFERYLDTLRHGLSFGAPSINWYETDLELEVTLDYMGVDGDEIERAYRELEDDITDIIDRVGHINSYNACDGVEADVFDRRITEEEIMSADCNPKASYENVRDAWTKVARIYDDEIAPIIVLEPTDGFSEENFYVGLQYDEPSDLLTFGIINEECMSGDTLDEYYRSIDVLYHEVTDGKRNIQVDSPATTLHDFDATFTLAGVAYNADQIKQLVDRLYSVWKR